MGALILDICFLGNNYEIDL